MNVVSVQNPADGIENHLIKDMHRLRARVFRERLGWNMECTSEFEVDRFDEMSPTYILCLTPTDVVIGCVRLLPAKGTTMLQSVFPQLLQSGQLATHGGMIESSRFCVDTDLSTNRTQNGLHPATLALFAGIVEWSLLYGYTEIVTATDVRLERILRRIGWPLTRLGDPVEINETRSVAGLLPVDRKRFNMLRPSAYSSSFQTSEEETA
ncbi:acyl-homoserine-lactone synthase [Agrobacterium sp. ES01]|uniref:acyl-homoserine-lactone synthase n=1 Tax=Agrobacterium sp. ES01 TaxID=3420714 RepID=UPI003D145BCA